MYVKLQIYINIYHNLVPLYYENFLNGIILNLINNRFSFEESNIYAKSIRNCI